MYYLLIGSVSIAAVFNAKEDSLKLKLLATGLSPNVVRCVGALRRSVRQKQKEEEEKAYRPGKRRTNVRAKDKPVRFF